MLGALALLLAQPKAAALDTSTATASKTLSSTSEQPATQAPPYLTSSDAKEIRNPAAALSTAPTAAKPAGEAAGFSTSQSATQPESKSQNATDLPAAPAKIQPYTYVEQMPVFKSGEAEMIKFLGQNIKYPQEAQAIGAEGLVVLSMVIGADGSVQDVEIIKSVEPSIDSEAMRVVKTMNGKWQPGRQNGKAVPVRYMLPVRFAIK
ncbi:energy transducer TonB [Pontibacter rugosus]